MTDGMETPRPEDAPMAAAVETGDDHPTSGSLSEGVKAVATVTIVTAVAAGLLGLVYGQTKGPIDEAQRREVEDALRIVLPVFDNRPLDKISGIAIEGARCAPAMARQLVPDGPADAVLFTGKKGDVVTGRALLTCTANGFGPPIDLLVAARPDGTVSGAYVLAHQETPGLGAKAADGQADWPAWREECTAEKGFCKGTDPFLKQFANRASTAFRMKVRKDGGEVDAITASTITSRAVADAIADSLARIATADGAAAPGGAP